MTQSNIRWNWKASWTVVIYHKFRTQWRFSSIIFHNFILCYHNKNSRRLRWNRIFLFWYCFHKNHCFWILWNNKYLTKTVVKCWAYNLLTQDVKEQSIQLLTSIQRLYRKKLSKHNYSLILSLNDTFLNRYLMKKWK